VPAGVRGPVDPDGIVAMVVAVAQTLHQPQDDGQYWHFIACV
jgi:hypothetical protein